MENEDDLEPIFGGPYVEHIKWFSKNENRYLVMLIGEFIDINGIKRFMNDCISYAQYVLYKEKEIILKPWEEIYYINRDMKDDRIENLKVIDTRPQPIEVKYPYDPEKYNGILRWYKNEKKYYVYLYLKKEYRNSKMLRKEKQIQKSISTYITETEKLKRFLNDNEIVIFIDGDKTNYDKNNLKVIKGRHSKYPTGEVPYQHYYIGKEYLDKRYGTIHMNLFHIKDKSKDTSIYRSKYKYEVKLGRKLEHNEYLVYKDNNHLNDNIDNLTHKTYPQAEYPFEDYYIAYIFEDERNLRKTMWLYHKTDSDKNLSPIFYSRYRKQVIEGRLLSKYEEVDHIDGNKFNDADDNLQILTVEEHRKKSAQEKKEIAPKIEIISDDQNIFQLYLGELKAALRHNKNNSLFKSKKDRQKYIQEGNKVKYKKLIKYTCEGTSQEIWIPENARFISSRFNPDALPFSSVSAVLKWMKNK